MLRHRRFPPFSPATAASRPFLPPPPLPALFSRHRFSRLSFPPNPLLSSYKYSSSPAFDSLTTMSGHHFDRSFHRHMSERLLRLAANFEVDNKIVPWEELISHPPHLLELAVQLRRTGWPSRTWKEVQQELLRLHARWEKKKPTYKTEAHLRWAGSNPNSWAEESEDDDDIFMPSEASKRAASSKGKGEASSKGKGAASSKGKGEASSKGKGAASSKSKGAASADAGGCVDGR